MGSNKGHHTRSGVGLMLGVLTVAVLLGCGGGGGGAGTKAVAKLPRIRAAVFWVGEFAPPGSTLADAAQGLGTLLDDSAGIKSKFERIAASDDPYGEALVVATCLGLENIADQHAQDSTVLPASEQSWSAYLDNTVKFLLPGQSELLISPKVNSFNTAAQLASVQPRFAQVYVEGCALGRKK